MKHYLLFISLFTLLIACKKDDPQPIKPEKIEILCSANVLNGGYKVILNVNDSSYTYDETGEPSWISVDKGSFFTAYLVAEYYNPNKYTFVCGKKGGEELAYTTGYAHSDTTIIIKGTVR